MIVLAACRGRGYGAGGLRLLCAAARANGLPALWDNIAADNPAVGMFLKQGFTVAKRDAEAVWVVKELYKKRPPRRSLFFSLYSFYRLNPFFRHF